jgi:hypothetical protein
MSAKPSVPEAVETDPVMAAFERAPEGPPLTDEEKKMVEAAREGGGFVRHADVARMIAERARDEG